MQSHVILLIVLLSVLPIGYLIDNRKAKIHAARRRNLAVKNELIGISIFAILAFIFGIVKLVNYFIY